MHIYTNLKNQFFILKDLQKHLLSFVITILLASQVMAQVPLNDDPCNATTLSATSITPTAACSYATFTNIDASNSTNLPNIPAPSNCANFVDADVWFTSVVPAGATALVIDTKNLGMTDGGMNVYTATGTCPNLVMTEIACADAGSSNPSMPKITVTQPAGTRIYIRMYGWGGEVGTFGICVTANIPPANDECINAQPLTVNPNLLCGVVTGGTTNNSTQSTTLPNPTCGAVNAWNDDVWFSFVATAVSHRVSLLNVSGGTTNMTMNVYSGTCTALTSVGCINGNTLDVGGLIVGNTYFVRVYTNVTTTATANFNICIGTPPPPPANDECINAAPLTVNPDYACGVVTAGTTVSATLSNTTPFPSCTFATISWNDDVWFSFVATSTRHRVSLANTGGVTDMITSVYSGTCTSLVELQCTDPDPNTINLTGLTVGNTYYVRVMTWSSAVGVNSTFNVCVGTPPPAPVNDNCVNALNVIVNPNYLCGTVTPGTVTSANPSTGVPAPSCSATGADDDVWFKFTTGTSTTIRVNLQNIVGTVTAMTSVIYSGTDCNNLTEVNCNITNLYNVNGLLPNTTYFLRVFTTTATTSQEVTFNVCIGTPPPAPSNDECTGAISLTVNPNPLCGTTTIGSTAGATQSTTLPTPTCATANGWDDDVWYSFVAVSNNHTVSLQNINGTTTNMTLSVYSAAPGPNPCANLTQIACSTTGTINLSTLTPGNLYYVRVHTTATGQDATFNICVGTPGPGSVCTSGNPFCSTSGVVYPSVTGQPSLGTISCLFTTPNPTWFAFQVSSAGNLVFQVSQTNTAGLGIDVDYAAWGPFTSQAAGCTSVAANPASTVSCSYSAAAVETVTIPNAQVGQWYIVLITNFNGGAGTISFNTTTGNVGSTNCNIVCNTTAANNGPVCTGGTFNLTSTAITGSTFAWTGPNGYTSNIQNPTNIVASTTAGTYTYNVTASVGAVACPASTIVIVTAPPPAPTVTTPLTYCQNSNAIALTATTSSPTNTLVFYTVPTGGIGVATLVPSTATIGSTTYYVSQKNGNCEGPRVAIVVNIVASTTAPPEVASPVNYCQGATATPLTTFGGSNLLWYTALTGTTGSTTAPTPSTTASGSTTYYVSQTIGTCESPKVSITVNVTAYSPTPTGATPVNYCQNATAVPLSATGTNLLWYTTPTGGTGNATAPTPNTSVAGSITYYVTQTSNGCQSLRFAITVNVTANPAAPTVVTPITYCQGAAAAQLTATSTSTLTWYATATATTGSATAPTPSTTTVGSSTYFVGASNGVCQGPRSSITVNINATPAAPIVIPTVIYCQGATATALTATGTNVLWYTQLVGGTGSTTAPTPSTTSVGNTTYYASSTLGNCEGPRATITVTVNATPAAPIVVTPVTYCQSAIAIPLAATGSGLLWYTNQTGGTGNATAPTPSTASGGSTTYYVSSTLGTCEGPRSSITVTVTATPAAPTVVSPVKYCQADVAVPLTASGTNIIYYANLTGGTGSTTPPTPSTVNAGTTNYYVTQSTSGVVCESPRSLIAVIVNPKPIAPTVISPLAYCQNSNALVLAANGATGNTYLWYNVAAGGTSTAAPIPSTSTVGSTTYYVSQLTPQSCEGPRSSIIVNISPALTVNAGNDTIIARGNSIKLNGSSTGILPPAVPSYLWTSNILPLSLSSATIANPIANPIFTTRYTLKLTDTSGLCPSVTDFMDLTVVQSCINVRNAFTPNGDGINDKWLAYDQNFCLTNPGGCRVNIFNRYGSKVFESKDYANNWEGTYNGKPLPDGTYYAIIEFILFDGSKQTVRTDITILR